MFIEHLPCQALAYVILFNPHNNPLRKPCYDMTQWEKRGTEETSAVSKVAQLVSDWVIKYRFLQLQTFLHLTKTATASLL